MQASREAILNYLHRNSQATVRELAALLGQTPTGIRQHLEILERDGLVQAQKQSGHVGRPALVYGLTERAEASFPNNYASLINFLLEELRVMAGAEPVQRLLRLISARMAESYSGRVAGKALPGRVHETAAVLREFGSVVDVERRGNEYFVHQCTCPYPEVAKRHSAVCAMEVDFVQRMTGSDARLVSSLLRGDDACTYRIRPVEKPVTSAKAPNNSKLESAPR